MGIGLDYGGFGLDVLSPRYGYAGDQLRQLPA